MNDYSNISNFLNFPENPVFLFKPWYNKDENIKTKKNERSLTK